MLHPLNIYLHVIYIDYIYKRWVFNTKLNLSHKHQNDKHHMKLEKLFLPFFSSRWGGGLLDLGAVVDNVDKKACVRTGW